MRLPLASIWVIVAAAVVIRTLAVNILMIATTITATRIATVVTETHIPVDTKGTKGTAMAMEETTATGGIVAALLQHAAEVVSILRIIEDVEATLAAPLVAVALHALPVTMMLLLAQPMAESLVGDSPLSMTRHMKTSRLLDSRVKIRVSQ